MHKQVIKKVLVDIREGLLQGADTAICQEGLVKPSDIHYRKTDVALPLLILRMPDREIKLHNYDMHALRDTLLQIKKGALPAYLEEIGLVGNNKQLVNVGAIILRKMADREMQQHARLTVKKLRGSVHKGKRRW
ncbi:hypothetical protein [Chitinophaga tropicalis]|uniref:Uncharacterized protein n=1 Tax=Chitinophaga tropicalis TaxID=2683588 RepID=A0A7K1U155_9BACT|nr:hypothetical protein [Chitinophaga tropicalis]MVT07735.1 hypothetical protein [Chitinophaga tropicalis]